MLIDVGDCLLQATYDGWQCARFYGVRLIDWFAMEPNALSTKKKLSDCRANERGQHHPNNYIVNCPCELMAKKIYIDLNNFIKTELVLKYLFSIQFIL